MRHARFKVNSREEGPAYYHCMSRVVDRQRIFGEPEKTFFRKIMREYERFCGVRVLTFAVMSNHFHVLLEVPKAPAILPNAEEVLRRLSWLSGMQDLEKARKTLAEFRAGNDIEGEREWLKRYHARMWDVSAFMKLLKQRFSQWFNHERVRTGTLWEQRFKSVLVEGNGKALAAVAAYIDLNPVRARLVADPKNYRWSGYGEAMGGQKRAKLGIRRIVEGLGQGKTSGSTEELAIYRTHLCKGTGEIVELGDPAHRPIPSPISEHDPVEILNKKGILPLTEYLRCRIRYFSDAGVLGSRQFVNGIFHKARDRFGSTRKTGARKVRGLEDRIYCIRDLRTKVFGL